MTAALLKDVLPVAGTPETVRCHLHKVATRQDAELGTGQPRRASETVGGWIVWTSESG